MSITSTYSDAKALLAYAIAHATGWASLTGLADPGELAARVLTGAIAQANVPRDGDGVEQTPYCWITSDGSPLRRQRIAVDAFDCTMTLLVYLRGGIGSENSDDEAAAAAEADALGGFFADTLRACHMAAGDSSGTLLIVSEVRMRQEPLFDEVDAQEDRARKFETFEAIFEIDLGDRQ